MNIVYCSRTGYTQEYAQLLGRAEKLRVYNLEEAKNQLEPGEEIFYLGPLMGGSIVGWKEVRKRFAPAGVCGVGMSAPVPQVAEDLARRNETGELSLFYLQGGWAPDRVGWLEGRTPEEQIQLEFLIRGGSFVSLENLQPIRDWLAGRGAAAD